MRDEAYASSRRQKPGSRPPSSCIAVTERQLRLLSVRVHKNAWYSSQCGRYPKKELLVVDAGTPSLRSLPNADGICSAHLPLLSSASRQQAPSQRKRRRNAVSTRRRPARVKCNRNLHRLRRAAALPESPAGTATATKFSHSKF